MEMNTNADLELRVKLTVISEGIAYSTVKVQDFIFQKGLEIKQTYCLNK